MPIRAESTSPKAPLRNRNRRTQDREQEARTSARCRPRRNAPPRPHRHLRRQPTSVTPLQIRHAGVHWICAAGPRVRFGRNRLLRGSHRIGALAIMLAGLPSLSLPRQRLLVLLVCPLWAVRGRGRIEAGRLSCGQAIATRFVRALTLARPPVSSRSLHR